MAAVIAALRNPVREYRWGSHDILASLQGRACPTPSPEAELWLGAHPTGPSTWLADGAALPLDAAIAAEPERLLGPETVRRYGPQLPFLLKVLAVAQPLSLQAHPTASQARRGYEREGAAGLGLDAPERNYKDPWPKPELVRAVSRFEALCGYRDVAPTLELADLLEVAELTEALAPLRSRGAVAFPEVTARLLRRSDAACADLVAALGLAGARVAADSEHWASVGHWLEQLAQRYPADPGVAVAALLELIELSPGESLHVPPGTLHCYLAGCAVEIMASSDNVLRGGLTAKHVDVDELLQVVRPPTDPSAPRRVEPRSQGPERVHAVPVGEFRLSEFRLEDDRAIPLVPRGPQLLLAIGGTVEVVADGDRVPVASGQGAFVAAAATHVSVRGAATLFRATVGDAA